MIKDPHEIKMPAKMPYTCHSTLKRKIFAGEKVSWNQGGRCENPPCETISDEVWKNHLLCNAMVAQPAIQAV
jgi:hypothetical protein